MSESYEQILTRGTLSALDVAPVTDGKIRFVTDAQKLFIDYQNQRIEISDFVTGYTESQILALSDPLGKFYFASDTRKIFIYDATEEAWINITNEVQIIDNLTSDSSTDALSAKQGKVLKELIDDKADADHTHDDRYYTESEINQQLSGITTAINALNAIFDEVLPLEYPGNAPYKPDALCRRQGKIYQNTSNTTVSGTWNSDYWTQVRIGNMAINEY